MLATRSSLLYAPLSRTANWRLACSPLLPIARALSPSFLLSPAATSSSASGSASPFLGPWDKKHYVAGKIKKKDKRAGTKSDDGMSSEDADDDAQMKKNLYFLLRKKTVKTSELIPMLQEAKASPFLQDFLDPKNINNFFSINPSLLKKIPLLPGFVSKNFGIVRRTDYLQRECMIDLLKKVNAGAASDKGTRILIDGHRGVGKSVLLMNTILHCMKENWIVIYEPSLRADWAESTARMADPFGDDPYLRQPETCTHTMACILSMNSHILSKFKLQKVYESPRRHAKIKPLGTDTTLVDLLKYGVENEPEADLVLNHFFRELKNLKDTPILFALEEANVLYSERSVYLAEVEGAHSISDFSIPRFYLDMLTGIQSMPKTVTIGSTCLAQSYYRDGLNKIREVAGSWEVFEVPRFNTTEISRLLAFYESAGLSLATGQDVSEQAKLIRLATGGSAEELVKNITLLPGYAFALPKEYLHIPNIHEIHEKFMSTDWEAAMNSAKPLPRFYKLEDVINDAADPTYVSPFDIPSPPPSSQSKK